jgi:uncharacterized protein (TIGR02217 family)
MVSTYPELQGLSFNVIRRSLGGSTAENKHPSGRSTRIAYWIHPMYEWELTYDLLRDFTWRGVASEFRRLEGFHQGMHGKLLGFYFRDPDDSSSVQQFIAATDGMTSVFPVIRSYVEEEFSGAQSTTPVTPFPGTMKVYIDGTLLTQGVHWFISGQPGANTINFISTPPAGLVIRADFDFVHYVHFKDDELDFEKWAGPDGSGYWAIRKVTLASLRPDVSALLLV